MRVKPFEAKCGAAGATFLVGLAERSGSRIQERRKLMMTRDTLETGLFGAILTLGLPALLVGLPLIFN